MRSPIHSLRTTVVALALLAAAWSLIQPIARAQESAAEIEQKCIEILRSGAPPADKAIPCKQLAVYGSKKAVPALAPLLSDPELASWARIALEAIPDPSAEEALMKAASGLEGRLLIGVLNSLGVRQVEKAVPMLIATLSNPEPTVASAAAAALGRIGNDAAARALTPLLKTAGPATRNAVAEGCILCAEQRLKAGRHADALAIYQAVRAADISRQKNREATRGVILAMRSDGVPELSRLLRSDDRDLVGLGLQIAREIPGPAVASLLAAECKVAGAPRREYLLLALAERGDTEALPLAMDMASKGSLSSRQTAIGILDRLADKRSVKTLLEVATENHEVLSPAAQQVLARLPGVEIDRAIVALVNDPKAETRTMAIDLAAQRRVGDLVPALFKAARDSDESVRQVAMESLGALASIDDIKRLVALLVEGRTPADIRKAESMVISVSKRHEQAAPGSIRIVKAVYGSLPNGPSKDVTKKVAELVKAGAVEIEAGNDLFGDPAPGVVKSLRIDYQVAGTRQEQSVPENGVLTLTARRTPPEAIEAVLEVLPGTSGRAKLALFHLLRAFGGQAALTAVRAATTDPNAEVRETALRALLDWPTAEALPDVARLAREATDFGQGIVALRSYIRLAQAQEAPPEKKLATLKDAWSLAQRDEEKKRVLAALGTVHTTDSLALIEPHLDDAALREEAAVAVLSVARNLPGSRPRKVTAALKKVQKVATTDRVRREARELLAAD